MRRTVSLEDELAAVTEHDPLLALMQGLKQDSTSPAWRYQNDRG
jgi:hypothetical protein